MMCLMMIIVLLMATCVSGQDFQNCTDCYTTQCVSVGDEAHNIIDRSVNPCDNFYQYACGGWLQQQFLTNERRHIKITDTEDTLGWTKKLLSQEYKDEDPDAVKKARMWFKLCQNYAIGYRNPTILPQNWHWPLGCEQCNLSDFNLEQSLQLATRNGVHPLFKLSAEVNRLGYNETTKIANRYLHISEPILQMPVTDYTFLLSHEEFSNNYANMIVATFKRFYRPVGLVRDEAASIEDAKQIVNVEREIVSQISSNQYDTTKKSSLGALNDDYGQLMNWTRYILNLASGRGISVNITLNETIFVKQPRRLKQTIDYFLKLPKRTQVNYIMWRWIDTFENVIVKPEDKMNAIITFGASEDVDPAYRDEGCTRFVTQTFPMVVDRLLFAEYVPQDTVQKVDSMLRQMKFEFNALLSHHNYDWLTENAKKIIKEKIDSITASVDYYFEVMDNKFLDEYYYFIWMPSIHTFMNQLSTVKIGSFTTNFRSIRGFRGMKLATAFSEQQPQVFSPYLATEFQTILLSFSSLAYPWFLNEAPMAVNYAGATHTLAQELLKSIDTKGMRFYKNGTEGLSMGDAFTNGFRSLVRCMIRQYYTYSDYGFREDYEPNSDLADVVFAVNLALKLTYKAYINYTNTAITKRYNIGYSGFTNDQLFFVRYAQLMCTKEPYEEDFQLFENRQIPSEFRVNAPLQNSKDFAYVFNCPCGSPMNPNDKCVVF